MRDDMKINFIVEDMGKFKYLGCATAAKNLYNKLADEAEVYWNDPSLDFDIAHFHTFGPLSLRYAKRFNKKKIITAHSTPNLNVGNIAFSQIINLFYKPIYNMFDHIIAVSNKCRRELIEMNIKPDVTTIYNGIDQEKFLPDMSKRDNFRKKFKIDEKELVVLTVAQRTPRKGIYDFIDVAKRFPNFRFVWVGGYPYSVLSKQYGKILKTIQNCSKNTIFPGFIEDITEAYSASDVFFMPSYAEGHSIVMLESLAMNLPMIARKTEEFVEAFGENLIYFEDSNKISEKYFDKILLQEYKEKSKIVSNFDINNIIDEHLNLYAKTMENK
jgi:glycosyltransferase involved in cell wall biosynthesis